MSFGSKEKWAKEKKATLRKRDEVKWSEATTFASHETNSNGELDELFFPDRQEEAKNYFNYLGMTLIDREAIVQWLTPLVYHPYS